MIYLGRDRGKRHWIMLIPWKNSPGRTREAEGFWSDRSLFLICFCSSAIKNDKLQSISRSVLLDRRMKLTNIVMDEHAESILLGSQ